MASTRVAPEITPGEAALLRVLRTRGAMSPSLLAARLLSPPEEVWPLIDGLSTRGMLIVRDDPNTIDGRLVIPTVLGTRGVKRLI